MVVTTGATRREKLQSKCIYLRRLQTLWPDYRPDALPVTKIKGIRSVRISQKKFGLSEYCDCVSEVGALVALW